MPKSGSTFLTRLLEYYLPYPVHNLIVDYGKSEQELSWIKLAPVIDSDAFFVHQHVRASENTLKIISLFNIHTIVMTRNLADSVVSFRDHILNESPDNPMAYVDGNYRKWDCNRQYAFVVDLIIPWYLNFLCTWVEAKKRKDISLLWLNYCEWINDPLFTLKEIDRFCGRAHREADAYQALTQTQGKNTRLNIGKRGRGKELLSDELLAKISHLVSYYPALEPYLPQLVGR